MGTLIVPTIKPIANCTGSNTSTATTSWWVGLGGDGNVTGYYGLVDTESYQAGVIGQTECVAGDTKFHRQYFAFWEIYPGSDVHTISVLNGVITPGDTIALSVGVGRGGQIIYSVFDGSVGKSDTQPGVAPSPSNTAEFMAERNILDSGYTYPLPPPAPQNQSGAFTNEMAVGNTFVNFGTGQTSFTKTFTLNTSTGVDSACELANDYCGTSFTYFVTQNLCDMESGVGTLASTGGFLYTQYGLPGANGC